MAMTRLTSDEAYDEVRRELRRTHEAGVHGRVDASEHEHVRVGVVTSGGPVSTGVLGYAAVHALDFFERGLLQELRKI